MTQSASGAPRDLRCAVVSCGRAVDQPAGGGLAGPQVHGERDRRLRLQVDRLVHGAALVAGEDVLQTGQRGVLTRGRERLGLDAVASAGR